MLPESDRRLVDLGNTVLLKPRLYSDGYRQPDIDMRFSSVSGPRFMPDEKSQYRWNDLEVIVTPEKLTARWNGQPFSARLSTIQDGFNKKLDEKAKNAPWNYLGDFRPSIDKRGGLGIYVYKSSASFRAVEVIP
jgi:hypothetical protein